MNRFPSVLGRCISFDSTSSQDLKVQLTDILERFQKDRRYRNDERYLKLWMRYVSQTRSTAASVLMMIPPADI